MQPDGRWQKWILSSILALVVGVVSNGIWQHLGDPLYVALRDAVLNLATLGVATFKSSLYESAARHNSSQASVITLDIVALAILYGLVLARYRNASDRVMSAPSQQASPAERFIALGNRASAFWLNLNRRLFFVAIVVLVVVSAIRSTYVSAVTTNFDQLVAIDAPYLQEQDVRQYRSRFAQMRTADEYKAIQHALSDVANQHHLLLPDFEPW